MLNSLGSVSRYVIRAFVIIGIADALALNGQDISCAIADLQLVKYVETKTEAIY